MKHLDITIDFETCAMSANAAPMQVAMVPWARENETDPFLFEDNTVAPYVGYVDLRSCVVDGFDFDHETIRWWAERNVKAKDAVCEGFAEPVADVLIGMLNYTRGLREKYELTSICVWSQGTDFDIAILKNLCCRYDIKLDDIVKHTQFRDCRTMILEAAIVRVSNSKFQASDDKPETLNLKPETILSGSYDVYKLFDPLPKQYAAGSEAHDALYDALRSSWNTWQALKWLNK